MYKLHCSETLSDNMGIISIHWYGNCIPLKMVGLERLSDYKGVGLQMFHCIRYIVMYTWTPCFVFTFNLQVTSFVHCQ